MRPVTWLLISQSRRIPFLPDAPTHVSISTTSPLTHVKFISSYYGFVMIVKLKFHFIKIVTTLKKICHDYGPSQLILTLMIMSLLLSLFIVFEMAMAHDGSKYGIF